MNAIISFISKYRVIIVSTLIAFFIIGSISFLVHWEIQRAKDRAFDKAKELIVTPEKMDKASKAAGRVIFNIKNFKNKTMNEVKRLEDSTKN